MFNLEHSLFFDWLWETFWTTEKPCRRRSEKILTINLTEVVMWSIRNFLIDYEKLYEQPKNPADVLPRKSWQKIWQKSSCKAFVIFYLIIWENLRYIEKSDEKLASSRSKPIRVLTPKYLLAQMQVHSLGFNRTEAILSIGSLPAQEKTEQFFFPKNRTHSFKPIGVLTRLNPSGLIEA